VDRLATFPAQYGAAWAAGMRAKLGVPAAVDDAVLLPLVDDLLTLLQANHVDYTSFFAALGTAARGDTEPARELVLDLAAIDSWLTRWRATGPDAAVMDRTNPVYIVRNHLVEEALTAAVDGDLDPFRRLVEVVSQPFTVRPGLERYASPAPEDFGAYRTFCGT
jgi:uncharacterized protein YdiU (UPF0061 family)